MNRNQTLLSVSLLACALGAQPAFAADAPAAAAASASREAVNNRDTLEEVVVTAERRVSTAQSTAASISVRSGDDMLTQGRYSLASILEDVPGIVGGAAASVNTSQGSGTDNPATGLTIRGVQSNSGAGGSITSTAAAAALYVDDVYNGIGGGYSVDRVEVLRGPQGTLYGRSATAGVVAIHTNDPNTAQLSSEGAVEIGNYNLRHLSGDANLPLVEDQLALRLSGNLYERDGYYSAKGGAIRNSNFRAKALWKPSETFSLLVGYAQENNETNSGGVTISQARNAPGDFTYTQQAIAPPGKNDSHQYWANFNLDLGPVAVTYIPAYRTWYEKATAYLRGTILNANQTIYVPNDSFLTHELRIRSTDTSSKFQWQAGLLYYRNALSDSNDFFMLPSGPYAFRSRSHKSTLAEGGFAEGTYAFAPDTRLTVGGRYDYTRINNTQDYTSILGITKSLSGDEGLRTFNNFTYKVRLEHDLSAQNLLYASISTGFSPGDITLTTDADFQPVAQVLDSETLTAYEVGSKNRFLDNHLQVNGAIFYYDYGAYQTAAINTSPQTPQTPTFNTVAAPMKSYGAELEVLARPWPNGTLTFNGSYTHPRYGDLGQYESLFSSHTVPGVAPFQGSAAYDHRFHFDNATLLVRGAVRYFTGHATSSMPDSVAAAGGEPYAYVSSHAIADFNASLLLGSHYSITAYVRNIGDSRFIPDGWSVASFPGPPNTPPVLSDSGTSLSSPRTVGALFTFKY